MARRKRRMVTRRKTTRKRLRRVYNPKTKCYVYLRRLKNGQYRIVKVTKARV